MAILKFGIPTGASGAQSDLGQALSGYSIEVMPRTAAKIPDFRAVLPQGTRVYIAHIDGTPIQDMVETAKRLRAEGFEAMPHIPARIVANRSELSDWIARYQGEAGVEQALLLAGGVAKPKGGYHSSIQLLETGCFDRAGFKRLHVAGHPEGNRDIDPDGSDTNVMAALNWKQSFSERSDAETAIVTQFAFDAAPIMAWDKAIRAAGIHLPVHLGIAGPARLQTLIKYAVTCGVGPSFRVLQNRARDVGNLLRQHEPTQLVQDIAEYRAKTPATLLTSFHIFPLGGFATAGTWAAHHLQRHQNAASQG